MTETTFSDIEADLVAWFESDAWSEFGSGHVGNNTPSDLRQHLPFVRVGLVAGIDDWITDYPSVDVDVFADALDGAKALAEQIRARLRPRTRVGSAIIDVVRTNASPRPLPWSNETIMRVSATYGLGRRR